MCDVPFRSLSSSHALYKKSLSIAAYAHLNDCQPRKARPPTANHQRQPAPLHRGKLTANRCAMLIIAGFVSAAANMATGARIIILKDQYRPIFYTLTMPKPPVTNSCRDPFVAHRTFLRQMFPLLPLPMFEKPALFRSTSRTVSTTMSTVPVEQIGVPAAGPMLDHGAPYTSVGYAELCVLCATLRYPRYGSLDPILDPFPCCPF